MSDARILEIVNERIAARVISTVVPTLIAGIALSTFGILLSAPEQWMRHIPAELQQVFLNLLKNGAHAMAAPQAQERTSRLILRIHQDGDMLRIDFEDNGSGMNEQQRRRVFEPFFTTKPVGTGTGLGLSISYFIIVKDHYGTLSVQSTPGTGTTFTIRLPLIRRSLHV